MEHESFVRHLVVRHEHKRLSIESEFRDNFRSIDSLSGRLGRYYVIKDLYKSGKGRVCRASSHHHGVLQRKGKEGKNVISFQMMFRTTASNTYLVNANSRKHI